MENNFCVKFLNNIDNGDLIKEWERAEFIIELIKLNQSGYYLTTHKGKFVVSNKNHEKLKHQIDNRGDLINKLFTLK